MSKKTKTSTKNNLAGMLNTLKDVEISAPDNAYDEFLSKTGKPVMNIEIQRLNPAPKEWNFFPPISEGKMLEMMFSIMENGLFNPIIVWELEDGYMILSGHNRVQAYKNIIAANDYDANIIATYHTIPAIVYGKNEIDAAKAKEIIIDTNYIQREEDKRLMPTIVKNRIEIVKNRKDKKGRTIDIVAKELGLSHTKVYEDQLIANRIIPELNELYFNGMLNKKALLRFAWFNTGVQKWIYDTYKDNINDDNAFKIRKTMNKEELKNCFKKHPEKMVNVIFRVPEKHRDEFREMAKVWLKEIDEA